MALAWSHNNQILATGDDNGHICLSSAQSGKKVFQIDANAQRFGTKQQVSAITSLCFSKNSEFLCCGMDDGIARIWNMQSKNLVANLMQPSVSRYTSEE